MRNIFKKHAETVQQNNLKDYEKRFTALTLHFFQGTQSTFLNNILKNKKGLQLVTSLSECKTLEFNTKWFLCYSKNLHLLNCASQCTTP